MSSSQAEIEEGARARSRVAADPAFAALDASGAPIVAVSGDPLQIIFHNDAAEAVFGADRAALATLLFGGERRQRETARRIGRVLARQGAALRLERLRLDLVDGAQNVTILCRKLEEPAAPDFFVIAALGLRALPRDAAPAPAAQEPPPDPPPAERFPIG